MLWAWARMLLQLSRFIEILREEILVMARHFLDAIIPSLHPILLMMIALGIIFIAISHFLVPLMTLRLSDFKTNAVYVASALFLLAIGGPALVFLEDTRIGLSAWMAEIARDEFAPTAEQWAMNVSDNVIYHRDGDEPPPLYKDALCPPPSAITETDTGSWDLSRAEPDQVFISDIGAWFLLSTYQDIWCTDDLTNRPQLPVRFAGTASVDVPVSVSSHFPYTDTVGGAFSIVGPPTISKATMQEVLCRPRHGAIPPACGYVDQIYAVLVNAGFDPAFWMTFAAKETEFGSTGPGRPPDYNFHNIRCNAWDGGGCNRNYSGGFSSYDSYMRGVQAWTELMCCRNVYVDRGRVTPEDIIPVYAPSFENDTALYIAQVKKWMTTWRAQDGGRVGYQPPLVPVPDPSPPPAPTPPAPTGDDDAFPGYFPFPAIDHLQAERRQVVLGVASMGLSRMWMGIILSGLGLLEQLMHFLFSFALTATWVVLMLTTLLTPFLPTRQAFSTVLKMVINVLKAAWISTAWVTLVYVLLELGMTNTMLFIGLALLGDLIVGWQCFIAVTVLFRGVGMDLGRLFFGIAKTAVFAAIGDIGGAMRSFAEGVGGQTPGVAQVMHKRRNADAD